MRQTHTTTSKAFDPEVVAKRRQRHLDELEVGCSLAYKTAGMKTHFHRGPIIQSPRAGMEEGKMTKLITSEDEE